MHSMKIIVLTRYSKSICEKMIDFVREYHCQKSGEENIEVLLLNHVHRKRHGHRSFYFNIEVAGYLIKVVSGVNFAKMTMLDFSA